MPGRRFRRASARAHRHFIERRLDGDGLRQFARPARKLGPEPRDQFVGVAHAAEGDESRAQIEDRVVRSLAGIAAGRLAFVRQESQRVDASFGFRCDALVNRSAPSRRRRN